MNMTEHVLTRRARHLQSFPQGSARRVPLLTQVSPTCLSPVKLRLVKVLTDDTF